MNKNLIIITFFTAIILTGCDQNAGLSSAHQEKKRSHKPMEDLVEKGVRDTLLQFEIPENRVIEASNEDLDFYAKAPNGWQVNIGDDSEYIVIVDYDKAPSEINSAADGEVGILFLTETFLKFKSSVILLDEEEIEIDGEKFIYAKYDENKDGKEIVNPEDIFYFVTPAAGAYRRPFYKYTGFGHDDSVFREFLESISITRKEMPTSLPDEWDVYGSSEKPGVLLKVS